VNAGEIIQCRDFAAIVAPLKGLTLSRNFFLIVPIDAGERY
jgi:hypothetical protein